MTSERPTSPVKDANIHAAARYVATLQADRISFETYVSYIKTISEAAYAADRRAA